MEHGEPWLAVDVEGQSNLVSWCSSTGLLAVGCTPKPYNGAASIRIVPMNSCTAASTLHVPLEGPDDQLVSAAFSTAAPPSGASRPRLLLTATRSGRVCCWSQQAPSMQPPQPTTWDRWFCHPITSPVSSSSSPEHPAGKAEVTIKAEGEGVPASPIPSSSIGQVVSASWLHVKGTWAWNPAAGMHALSSHSSCSQHTPAAVTARLDAPFYQPPPVQSTEEAAAAAAAAAGGGAAGSPFSWLSRASLAFAVLYRTGHVQLYWSTLGQDSQLRWSSTALLQLPAAADTLVGDPAPGVQRLGPTAVAAGAGNVVLIAAAPDRSHSSSSSSSADGPSTDLCLYQITGDPVYAAAAAAVTAPPADAAGAPAGGGRARSMQPELPVTLVTRHACPGDMRVTAMAWCPAGAAQRLALLLEPCGPVSPPSAAGAGGAAVMVQLLDVAGGQFIVAGQVTLRQRGSTGGRLPSTPTTTSSSSSRCVWSHDASWLSLTTSQGTCVVLDGQQLLPLQGGWAGKPTAATSLPGAAAGGGGGDGWQVSAVATSPNSCMVAVLSSSPTACGPGRPGTCMRVWGVQGGLPNLSGHSQQQQQQQQQGASGSRSSPAGGDSGEPAAEQQCAAAVGRCLWCLAQGTHHWDVSQLLLALPRPAACGTAPSAADAPPAAAPVSVGLPAALSAVDVAVMRHPQATRSVMSQRWDVLKLGIMQQVPGEDALRLAQELRLRLYILRVLRASMVLAEGAFMYWSSRHRKGDRERATNEDVVAVQRWNQWLIRAITLLLRVLKSWALARQPDQQPPAAEPAAAGASANGTEQGGAGGAAAEGQGPLVRLLLDADVRAALFKLASISHRITSTTELSSSKSLPQGSDSWLRLWLALTNEVHYSEEAAPSPAVLAETFPSPYQLHYHRPLAPAVALTERLEALSKQSLWNGLSGIRSGEVADMLQRWGLGWDVPPHVPAQYERQLQLHSRFRCSTPSSSSSSSSSSVSAAGSKRPAPAAGSWDPASGDEEGAAAQLLAEAKRGRWQAAMQLALGHPQACFTTQVAGRVTANGADPLNRSQLANALQKQTAAASSAATAALQGRGAALLPQQQMLLALDGSIGTTVGLAGAAGAAAGGGGGGAAADKPRGVAVMQPQQVAWIGASPITGELWEKRSV